jgi:diguanylate cyclase (GGDEF)-like protein
VIPNTVGPCPTGPHQPTLVVLPGGRDGAHDRLRPVESTQLLRDRRAPSPGDPLRLLLVEDSAADGRLVMEMIREAGADWSVERVERISEAQTFMDRHHVDCVLLDLGLLDADGLDGLRDVVARDASVPVVVLTRREDDVLSAEALRHGAQDYLAKRDLEPKVLIRAVRYAIERKATELQLVHLAQHDALTGLGNRGLFLDRLASLAATGSGLSVLFVDVDNLKLVNDSLGHAAGDLLLTSVARRLVDVVRPGDVVARFGGDEFAIVCAGLTDRVAVAELAGRLLTAVSAPLVLGTRVYITSVSIGVTVCSRGTKADSAQIMGDADVALYVAKRHGKARFEIFEPSQRTDGGHRLALLSELQTAMVEDQFEVHYQPEISLQTGALVAVEALVRWRHPSRGLLPAGAFIDAVEEGGMVASLGAWVMRQACTTLTGWPTGTAPRFAINISPRQFSVAGFVAEVEGVLEEFDVPADLVELEVTEAALLVDDSLAQVLRDLSGMGLRLAVDDFGTGYSSLNHLKMFPASTVKIDRTFVAGLGKDRTDEAIVAAVLGVAASLGLSTVGEGVETQEQLDLLTQMGCELGQGYLLGKAMSRAELYGTYGGEITR